MTIGELIAALEAAVKEGPATRDTEITTEGCDCIGDVGSLEYEPVSDYWPASILLKRSRR